MVVTTMIEVVEIARSCSAKTVNYIKTPVFTRMAPCAHCGGSNKVWAIDAIRM